MSRARTIRHALGLSLAASLVLAPATATGADTSQAEVRHKEGKDFFAKSDFANARQSFSVEGSLGDRRRPRRGCDRDVASLAA
jgi:hypothetical protein